MITVRIFHTPEEAWTARALLQAHGLDAQLPDDQTLSILPLDSVALGGYRLSVPEHQIEQANSLLEEIRQTGPAPARQYFGDEADEEHRAKSKPHPLLWALLWALGALLLTISIVMIAFNNTIVG